MMLHVLAALLFTGGQDRTVHVDVVGGYLFVDATINGNALQLYPLNPCRVADTRNPTGSYGGPTPAAGQTRTIAVPGSGCAVPASAQAVALNYTVVPKQPLGFLTTWPAGSAQPLVSTLNAPTGGITANAAIVPSGTNGGVNVFVSNASDFVMDVNGYFGTAGQPGGLSLYSVTPCRVADTRNPTGPFGGPSLAAGQIRSFTIPSSACGIPSGARAFSLNVTVVPKGSLGYLTAWAAGAAQPFVSTLNSIDASVVANAAIVPASADGSIQIYVTNPTDVILDINGYFAP